MHTCRSPSNKEGLLILAIRHQLEPVADRLCEMGVDLGASDQHGNSPLWVALRSRQETIATKLVSVALRAVNVVWPLSSGYAVGSHNCCVPKLTRE